MRAEDFLDSTSVNEGLGSAADFLDAKPAKKQNKGIVGDIGTGLKRGVEQMPGMVTGLADIAAAPVSAVTGINRPFSRAADYLGEKTGFQPSKWAEQAAQEYSPEMQQSLKNVEQADGFMGTLGAIAENPRSAINLVAESLPSTLAGGILARGAMGAVTGAEKLAALRTAAAGGDAAAKSALMKAGAIAGGVGEGAVTAGQQMAQTDYEADPLKAAGAATAAGIGTGIIGGVSGRVANKIGFADIEGSIASGTLGAGKKAGKAAYAGRIAGGALQEGALEEMPQSAQEQVWQNVANGKPWDEGVGKASAQGLVAGMAMGAGVNALPGSKYVESKTQPPAEDQQPIAGLLPAPNYTGTPGDQLIANDAERQAAIDAADANAAAVYAAREAFENQLRQSVTIINEPAPLQQRIDDMLNVDASKMNPIQRANYEKTLAAAFSEPIGIRHDANQREVPFTMGEYLDAQVAAENAVRARPLKQNAAQQADARLQQVADEEGYVAPEVPVVGTLSAMANMAIQSGAHKQSQMQQAMQAAVEKQKSTSEGSPRAAQPEQMATQAPQANDAQTPAFDVSTRTEGQLSYLAQNGQPGWKEAATAELVRLNGSISESVPALNAGNSVNLPATSISSLQDQLDKTEPFSEQSQLLTERLQLAVTDDAKSAIGAGEMPVYKVTDHVSVAIHPSAQKEGMIQVTRYTKDGVIGDSQYNSIDEAVRFEGLTHKPRIPSNEAIAHIENSIAAEAEYQKRKNEQQAGAGLPASTAGGSRPAPVANQTDADRYSTIKATPPLQRTQADVAWANEYKASINKPAVEAAAKAYKAKADDVADTDGYAESAGKNDALKQKIRNALNMATKNNGVIVRRKDLIRSRIADGATIQTREGQRAIVSNDGAYILESALTKTAIDYAEYLAGRRNQVPIKNAAPSAATVPAESVAPKQAPIKKDEQQKNASDRLRSGEINVEQFMEATGLTDDDVGTFSSNGARNKADAQAKKESRYHAGIEKISAAIFEAERGLTQGSTAQSRRAYQANVAKYRQAQETLGVIAKHYEHPFKNTLLSKLPPFLESRFGKQWDGIEYGDSAKRAFHGDSYRKWVDLLIGAADNKNGTPISPAVSQPKTDAAPEAAQDKAPVSTLQPDPALQNRDRGRAASVNQMQSIARNPDYMRLGPSRTPDSGAPMVFAVGNDTQKISPANFGANDIAVMSDGQRVPFRYAVVDARSVEPSNFADGATNPAFASEAPGTLKALNNGRTAGVRAAHEGSNATTYTAELLADGAHGVSPEAIRNTPNPMLVRVYAEQSNTGDMAAKSQGQGLGMSASERATQDAELMTADVLDKFAPGDIASAGNRDFVRAFVGKLAENELADMMDATGNLSQDGRRRIEAALLTAAYGKSDLVQELFESTDTDIKAIGNALKVMSGQWAAMRQAAKDGSIDPATDMTANLIEAVNIVRRSRAEGSSIAELAGQGDLMGGNYLNELSELFLRIFYKGKNYDRARGGDKVISALQEIVTSAMNTKAESGLFGDSFKATPKQIVESARSKIDEENKPASQSSLFGANGQATAVSQGNRSESAQKPGEVGSRPVSPGRGEEAGKQAEPVERSIADLQKALESAKFGERTELNGILIERVSEDAEQAIKQGEMPMYQTGQGTFVALHPSAQQDGMIQATRYSDTGVFGDSQYKEVKEAVRDNGLWFKRRLPDAEAARLLEQSIAAEAEYQERKNGASEPVAKAAEPAPADLGGQSKKVNASDEINMGGKISPNAGASEQSTEVKEPWMMTLDEILPSDAEISDDGNTGFADSKLYDYGNPDMSKLSDIGGGYSVAPVKGRDSILLLLKGEYRIGVYTGEFGIKAAYRSKGLATKLVKEAMRRGIYTPDESYSVGGAKTVEKAHKEIIREAIADGKQIPDEVLADYPDLKESGIALLSPSLGRVNADKVDIAVASKVVADLLSGWRNAPDSRVVATFDDLPAAVRKEIEDQGEKTARGVFHGDTFYLIADEHASANEIEETIFHEVWAHYGLRSMLGANTTRELAGVFDQISASGIMGVNGKDAFRAFARRNGFNTAQTESMLRKAEAFDPRFTEAMKKRILVEELIAKVQEKGDNPSLKRKAQEIIGAIREWLRKVGFSGLMKYSDADLMRLVQKARDTVKYGKRGSSGKGDVPSVLMTAWHGSPHDHDKFDSSKIGTGEGAQAYGYGHYFAGAKDVAEWYRRKLSGADNSSITFNGKQYGDSDAANRKLTNDVKKWAEETGRDPERIDVALEYLAGMAGDLGSARQLAAKEGLGISHWIYGTLNDLSEHLYPSPNGRLYQVELAPTADEYLDWDKPLSEQSEFVRNALTDKSHFIGEYLSDTLEIAKNNGVDFNERGDTLYKIVSDQYGSDKAASDYLHSIGIRGIRYLDGSSRSAGEGNSNYVIFNDADVSITAKYNIASKDKLTPADKAIYGMAAEGKSAAEVLKFIASASRSPFNRQVAKLLLKTGIAPSVTVGDGKGWKMNAGEGNKYAAGYNPKTDTISLFRPASSERNMLHELIHAATLKALSKKGMASAQMNALYQHVKKSGKLKGMYGMSDVDEFIAEAFSNPKFQAALKQVAAPSTSTAKSAWHWFVRVIKGILGLPSGSENALSQALEIGIGVMRENMRLNEGAGDVRYNAAPGKINQTDTEAFKRWFGDSAVVDSDGKPLRVFHGTASDITAFDIGRSGESTGNTGFYGAGAYFSEDADYASGFSFWARRSDDQAPNVVPVYLSLKNPAYINITPRSQAASEKSRATAEKIISTMIARGTDKAVVDKLQGFVSENKFEPFMGTLYNALGGGTGTTALLKEAGFDGVTIYGGISGKEKLAEAVAFDPTQIKSAIGNSGDFDATNPDIRYNVADEGGDIGRIVGDSVSDQLKAAVLRLSGRPMLDHTDPFAAENARLREQDQSLWSKAKKQLRRYLAPGGLLPQSVFAEKIKRDSEFQAVEFDVRHLIGGLEQAVKADFGIAFDKLSKEQMRPITEALAGKVPASLPEATKTAAVAMRQYIDGMSTEYLKIIQQKIDAKMLKALESGKDSDKAQAINEIELFEKIKGNIGRYVHRSYQAFDDPKWFEKVPAHVLNASRLYLKQGYMEAGENDAKASQMAEVTLHEILKNGTAYDSMESFIAESKLGAKDLSVLMRRKEVPAQIRALLGEYPDARLNFTKSATKMGRLIWNTRFLDRVRDMGMGSFFFEGKDRPPNATTQIAADGSEVYAPLNGLWTFPEIAQSFKDALGKEQMSDLYRAIVRFNGLVKYGKTVLAPTTAMRDWQSAMFFSLANGHFDLTQMKKSISAFREQVSQKATGQDLKYLRHLKQLGVVYDTPYAGEMARLMEDARMEELLSSDKGDAVRWFRKANQLAQGFYTFGDDFWKIIGFENEKAGLMKAGLSLQEAETEAAKRIRDTYPTYSMVGRGVQWLSRFPLAGTFVSFPAEIIRTSGNMLRTVAADLKSDNPKLRELGMKRAAGMVFVSAAFYSLAALSMAMAGVGDDEDEAIRDLAPEWQKNSTFLYLGRDEKGNLRYFDMSFLDPYGYWKRPITAMLRNQPWEDSLASGLRGMLEPFIGADIAAKAIFEAVANQKENGGKVYKEKDGAINQTIDVADHLRKALQPGVVGNVERLVKAAGDVRKSSGQPYSMEDELVALVGWRATTIDPKTALYYRSFEFTDAVAEARKTITETLRDANEITPEDIADAKARAQAKQEQAFKEMHRLVSAAESAGMSKMQIVQTLRLSNISQANIGSLMRGETPDVSITPQLAARAVRQASQMRGPEYAAEVFDRYRQARAN